MEKCERETIIRINRADSEEGYFTFDTSYKPDYERLLRRIGGKENALSVKSTRDIRGENSWIVRVPICYYRQGVFGIGKKRVGGKSGFKKKEG